MESRKSQFKLGEQNNLEIHTLKARQSELGKPDNASSSCPPPPPPAASPPPPWTELPSDITANILRRLGAIEILKTAQRVCTTWQRGSQDPAMWRVIDMNIFGQRVEVEKIPFSNIRNVCRLAVDRSQGQLIDISLDVRADDELLTCICQRSSKLRRLTIQTNYEITGGCLVEAVKGLPNLEELHIIVVPSVEAADVEVIGMSCPMLKSFTFNEHGSKDSKKLLARFLANDELLQRPNNAYALAIVKTMPNLHHLRLFSNYMNNEGLQAILDGCPHLESLDIRQCFYLDLQGDLGKRLSKQIRNLKLPSDSISDIAWLVAGYLSIETDGGFFDDYYGYDDDSYYNYDYDENVSLSPQAVSPPSPAALPPPLWTQLPRDVTANILQRLGAVKKILESAQRVCTTWRRVFQEPPAASAPTTMD